MRNTVKFVAASAMAIALAGSFAAPASAACTRLAFSVNDYGKDGPTKDAKELLDKYIAKKMAERGVTDYKTGTKTVTCELFLDVILFDEHTCKAEATVCWGGSSPSPASGQTAAAPESKPAPKDETAAAPADASSGTAKPAAN